MCLPSSMYSQFMEFGANGRYGRAEHVDSKFGVLRPTEGYTLKLGRSTDAIYSQPLPKPNHPLFFCCGSSGLAPCTASVSSFPPFANPPPAPTTGFRPG